MSPPEPWSVLVMCGIAGFVGLSDRIDAMEAVAHMIGALARRGPDGDGIDRWDTAVLGHRRLSIFDLSDAGRQPMVTDDRRIAVVFNGAIYNFLDLRAGLEARGHRFRSNTDTEVLLHGYREWGIDGVLSRILGMFAFALWDDRERRLFLVRDRLGVKPLVYTVRDGCLAFASSTRALRAAGLVDELDPQAMTEFLEYGYVTDDRTIYRGASKVHAATLLEWHDGKLSSRKYWAPPQASEAGISFADAVEETERLLLRAVERRLFADVPVGALLSGGIDSSLVCWAIARLGGDITAFTVGTPGDPSDETPDAVETARALGIRHQILPLAPGDAPGVDELVSAYGEPFACASALGMLGVSRIVKSSATVLLTGDGGDDVYLGYPEHGHLWMAQRIARRMPWIAARAWMAMRPALPDRGRPGRAVHFIDYVTGGMGAVASARDGLPLYRRNSILGPRLATAHLPQREMPWLLASARSLLAQFIEYDRRGRFVAEYMTKVDGATMHYALEARSPFLDQEIWEFAAALPFGVRLRGGQLKAVLRELARRHLGPRVATGRKRGFGIPVRRWIAGQWRTAVEDAFRDSVLDREGWIAAPAVLESLDRATRRGEASDHFWYLFVLESWLRRERPEAVTIPSTIHPSVAYRPL
jgi:asparagine synthase (glutamine-hydrolysing)